jgi:hypothetical protein
VALRTVKTVAGSVPNSTAIAPEKPKPVIITGVPPTAEPDAGLMPVIVGT